MIQMNIDMVEVDVNMIQMRYIDMVEMDINVIEMRYIDMIDMEVDVRRPSNPT